VAGDRGGLGDGSGQGGGGGGGGWLGGGDGGGGGGAGGKRRRSWPPQRRVNRFCRCGGSKDDAPLAQALHLQQQAGEQPPGGGGGGGGGIPRPADELELLAHV